MTTEHNADQRDDRRNYFRIDDEVILQYRQVPADTQEPSTHPERGEPVDGFSLGSRFAALSQAFIPVMREIESESKATARYLAAIDRKLDMLAQVLLNQELVATDKPTRKVNLGAGGIAFSTDSLLETGSVLELRLILLPEMIGLTTLGQVVASDPSENADSGFRYRSSLEFIRLREADRDLIVCHVRRREQEALRKGRLSRNGLA